MKKTPVVIPVQKSTKKTKKKRELVPRTRCGGQWTESRFQSFIKGGLRQMSMRWDPIAQARRNARVERGKYLCSACNEIVPASIKVKGKRRSNVIVDHVIPIIDPAVGFTSWDDVVEAMFCEVENLKVLCRACSDTKTAAERAIATARRRKEKKK